MWWSLGCATGPLVLGEFEIAVDGDTIAIRHANGDLDGFRPVLGSASGDIDMQFGSFRLGPVSRDLAAVTGFAGKGAELEIQGPDGDLGTLVFTAAGRQLRATISPNDASYVGFEADCDATGHFLGLGSHAFDVNHRGEAFSLWTGEPGIGKVDTNESPPDWFVRGTRHATSLPMPFVLRPELGQGLLLESDGRVDADLCASDPDRFSLVAWDDAVTVDVFSAPDAVSALSDLTAQVGRPKPLPDWALLPWNDAIHGEARVREVAGELRGAGAPSTVLWTEDWKGAKQTSSGGYQLTGDWTLDRDLYPNAEQLASDLDELGFRWFAYFSPFVFEGTPPWDAAVAGGYLIEDGTGAPYVFTGASLEPASMVDLSDPDAVAWFQGYMNAAKDVGFHGWMADYAEWLPVDAECRAGSGAELHNAWPILWQQANASVLQPPEDSWFARSGWIGTSALAPVIWGGDQKTSFDADDGLPTVVPLALGASASGIPVFTHDIGGYQSFGTTPGDEELYFRWAELGAFTPVMRTHHGAYDDQTWQFDSNAETLAHYARYAREHARLFPYLAALDLRAAVDGIPMILPVGLRFSDAGYDRVDAWLLGDRMLVAPVLERGATSRTVDLPAGRWFDWWTGAEVTSGLQSAPVDVIPVFVAEKTTIPTFGVVPETDVSAVIPDLADADQSRVVYLFGGGGSFTEADGTVYSTSGAPTGPADVTVSLASGDTEVGGLTVSVAGTTVRSYRFVSRP
jgi:alpha-glucosidase